MKIVGHWSGYPVLSFCNYLRLKIYAGGAIKLVLLIISVGLILTAFSCSGSGNMDERFEKLTNQYIERLIQQSPE